MTFSLKDLHTPKNVQELESVVLAGFQPARPNSGTFTFTESLLNFEEIVVYLGISDNTTAYSSTTLTRDVLQSMARHSFTFTSVSLAVWRVDIDVPSDYLSLSWIGSGTGSTPAYPLMIVGYRRKFSTTPICKTIDLGTIGLSENITLYEADLGSEFFNSDGTIKDSVKAEVWLNDGSMWFEAGSAIYNSSSADRYGALARKFNVGNVGGIRVRTGNRAANGLNNDALLTASEVTLASAPARLVLSMGERYAPTLAS